MFPSVDKYNSKEPKDEHVKERIRQGNWDDRFLIKNGIPDYSPMRDKHTKTYQKLLNNINSSSKKDELANNSSSKKYKVTFFEKRVELVSILKEKHSSYVKNIKEYEDVMSSCKIPNFYIYFSLLPLLDIQSDIPGYCFVQIKAVKQQTSCFHRISTSVRAREECLERMRKTLMRMKETDILTKKDELHEEMTHYRLLTSNCIDEIKRWRDKLGDLEEKAIYYTHGN